MLSPGATLWITRSRLGSPVPGIPVPVSIRPPKKNPLDLLSAQPPVLQACRRSTAGTGQPFRFVRVIVYDETPSRHPAGGPSTPGRGTLLPLAEAQVRAIGHRKV